MHEAGHLFRNERFVQTSKCSDTPTNGYRQVGGDVYIMYNAQETFSTVIVNQLQSN